MAMSEVEKRIRSELSQIQRKRKDSQTRFSEQADRIRRRTREMDDTRLIYDVITFMPGTIRELTNDWRQLRDLEERQAMLQYFLEAMNGSNVQVLPLAGNTATVSRYESGSDEQERNGKGVQK